MGTIRWVRRQARVGLLLALMVLVFMTGCPKAATPTPAVSPKPTPTTAAPSPKPPAPAKAAFKWPDAVVGSSLDVGASGYIIAGAIAEAMKKQGVTLRIVPVGTEQGRMSLLFSRRAQISFLPVPTMWLAQEGAFDFATIAWGPQPLSWMVTGTPNGHVGWVAAKDANIKTWADAKGKRVALPLAAPAASVSLQAVLAFAGLTLKDVVIVDVPSFGAGGTAVISGKADIGWGGSTTAWCYELASSPRGIAYPTMPASDVEGWKRTQAIAPYMTPVKSGFGAGLTEANPVEGVAWGFIGIAALEDADPELVYNLTKMVNEQYPQYSPVGLAVEQLDPKRQNLNSPVLYHQGAIRYYKEAGKWTAENQKNSDQVLARRNVLKAAWSKAIAGAADQKVAEKDFPAFWMKTRAESLAAAKMEPIFK